MAKKLLIFVKSIDGGTGTFTLDLLKMRGYELKTLVLERPSFREVSDKDFTFFATPDFYPQKYYMTPGNLVNFCRELIWIRDQLKDFNPDIVVSVDSHCFLLAQIGKQVFSFRYKIVATFHNHLSEILAVKSSAYLHPALTRLLRYFLNRADLVVGTSAELSKNLYEFFHLNRLPQTIYYGLDIKPVKKIHLSKRPRIIISVARLAEQKDHSTLIAAFAQIYKIIPDSQLWLVGDGPLKPQLTTLVGELNLDRSVKFWRWVQKPIDLINKADVFVLSSKREGFGYVIIEAMSQGKPVVATDCDFGPAEILGHDKYGLLVPKENSTALKEALIKVLTEPVVYKKYAKASLKRVRDFTLEKMLKNYREIIQ